MFDVPELPLEVVDEKLITLDEQVDPFWNKESAPLFLSRTKTEYSKAPISKLLEDRGLSNRLLVSLLIGLPDGAYIGGGFIAAILRDEKNATDIDIFFTSEEAFKKTLAIFTKYAAMEKAGEGNDEEEMWAFNGYTLFSNDKGLDFSASRYVKFTHPKRPAVQLIKLCWYDSPEHIIDSFDFTVVQFACDKEYIYFNPISLLDSAKKRLVLHRMQFPASTLRRLIKYTHKGFYCCPGSLITISESIQNTLADPNYRGEDNNFVYVD